MRVSRIRKINSRECVLVPDVPLSLVPTRSCIPKPNHMQVPGLQLASCRRLAAVPSCTRERVVQHIGDHAPACKRTGLFAKAGRNCGTYLALRCRVLGYVRHPKPSITWMHFLYTDVSQSVNPHANRQPVKGAGTEQIYYWQYERLTSGTRAPHARTTPAPEMIAKGAPRKSLQTVVVQQPLRTEVRHADPLKCRARKLRTIKVWPKPPASGNQHWNHMY